MGKIYVVGIGPGEEKYMTAEAVRALDESDCIVGYTTYIELVKDRYPDKELIATGMRGEIERCKQCVSLAKSGRTVSLICSGDSGVYGMASPLYETVYSSGDSDIEIEVVAGITAALSGASILGAPINHDFCVISLSDLLTPWELIVRRLSAAAKGDFCIVLYNPSSHKRADYIMKACDILLKDMSPDTVCGYVYNIGREGTDYSICSLADLREKSLDMFTTVFIGNSHTRHVNGKMITPRGYCV